MARFHARRSKPSVRVRRVALPAVADSHHGEQYRPTLTRLAAKPAHEPARVVDSLDRRYCRAARARPYTGPYYLAMSAPVVALGSGFVAGGIYAWLVLAAVILLGSKLLWWATEHAWGKYS
jgi:hypothetical protein